MTEQIQVAVRIRPLVSSEKERGSRNVLEVFNEYNQIRIKNSDKSFTFNYVFDQNSTNEDFYLTCVRNKIPNLFKGFNVTVLAYGQTGSGKTHTMGTSYRGTEEQGVIPRAVHDIFNYARDNFTYEYSISVSFIEIYQEVLYDLFSKKPREQSSLEIRGDLKGINIPGLTELPVKSTTEVFDLLIKGSLGRSVASTNMNSQSSRSHAIFTVNIFMQNKIDRQDQKNAKFHLVDLAGSERQKKTGASGNTFKEGININKGLMVLGNVISVLAEDTAGNKFVSYRDSNLTRLLKDSLGGNSITLMIACISPADYNLDETMSTLRYADRAKKIKNKPIVNQDPQTTEINSLKLEIKKLKLQLLEQGGPTVKTEDFDTIKQELALVKQKLFESAEVIASCLNEKAVILDQNVKLHTLNENLSSNIANLQGTYAETMKIMEAAIKEKNWEEGEKCMKRFAEISNKYQELCNECEKTNDDLIEENGHQTENSINHNNSMDATKSAEELKIREKFNQRQMHLNNEFMEVNKILALKEMLAQKVAKNSEIVIDYDLMEQNEKRIAALEKEKNDLLDQLKNVTMVSESTGKASATRKRVQELENQLNILKKKLAEQNHLIKLKAKDEQSIKQLQNEILNMKQNKVRLIRSMKEESDKFRTWKMQRNKEVIKLQQEDLKKKNQIKKMENLHLKQQQVLRRKVEEALRINKRLKDSLALRKVAQQQKNENRNIKNWIKQELDVHLGLTEIEVSLDVLLEDRAMLQKELDRLLNEENDNEEKIKAIQEDIDLRSVQISDMQQKKIEVDEDGKNRLKFDCIQSLFEAREALKVLLAETVEMKKKQCKLSMKNLEMISSDALEAQLKQKDEEWTKKLDQLEIKNSLMMENLRQYEDKMKTVSQITKCQRELKSSSSELLVFEMERAKMEEPKTEIKEELDAADTKLNTTMVIEKCDFTPKRLRLSSTDENLLAVSDKKCRSASPHQLRLSSTDGNETEISDNKRESISPKQSSSTDEYMFKIPDRVLSPEINRAHLTPVDNLKKNIGMIKEMSDSDFEDDLTADPDWRKTPLSKRLQKENRKTSRLVANKESFIDMGKKPLKRSASGGCACSTNCNKRCGCRRFGVSCSEKCKCSSNICLNQQIETVSD